MGLTAKPCPGCGKDRNGHRFRNTGKVCSDCARKIRIANQLIYEQKESEKAQYKLAWHTLNKCDRDTKFQPYIIPSANPCFYGRNINFQWGDSENHDKLKQAFWKLVWELVELVEPVVDNAIPYPEGMRIEQPHKLPGVVVCPSTDKGYRSGNYDSAERVLVGPKIRDLINDLYRAIFHALESNYLRGKEDGNNLLVKLAKGEITAKEYGELSMGEEEE